MQDIDRQITVNGLEIRVRDRGRSGPVVLVNHGIAAMLESWAEVQAVLCDRYRVIAWDLPGHGLSDPAKQAMDLDDFATIGLALLDRLKIGPVHVAGNSLGGAIGLRMAKQAPGRLASLTLVCSAGLGRFSPLPFRLFTLPVIGECLSAPGPEGTRRAIQAIFHDPARVAPEIAALWCRYSQRPGAHAAFLATLRRLTTIGGQRSAVYRENLRLLAGLTLPVQIIWGRHDRILPWQHGATARQHQPAARFEIIEGVGHMPQMESPEAFVDLFDRFLQDVRDGPGL